jgi:hypothetical protein
MCNRQRTVITAEIELSTEPPLKQQVSYKWSNGAVTIQEIVVVLNSEHLLVYLYFTFILQIQSVTKPSEHATNPICN